MAKRRHTLPPHSLPRPAPGRAPETPASRGAAAAPASGAARFIVFAVVGVTGAAVMVLEILGTRVIGPFYGVSLFVWSALISVTLLSLAAGYLLGGLWADKGRGMSLGVTIALAALAVACIPVMQAPVLSLTSPLGMRLGALASAFILFSAPLTLLAMVGPRAVKLVVRRLDRVGRSAGDVLAFSTAGSVAGTLLLGFFLIPVLGVRAILLSCSVLLFAAALAVLAVERRQGGIRRFPRTVATALLAAAAAAACDLLAAGSAPGGFVTVADREGRYGRVRVIDQPEAGVRWLLAGSSAIGAVRRGSFEPVFPYQWVLETLPYYRPGGQTALLLGLGAGSLPGALARYGIATDVIEIDPAVARAAREHFGFAATGELIIGDARFEISRLQKRYDFIIHDCFTGGAVPSYLLSREMLAALEKLLAPAGILALNFVGFAGSENHAALDAVGRTIRSVFAHQRLISIPADGVPAEGQQLADNVFFAARSPILIDIAAARRPRTRRAEWALRNREGFEMRLDDAPGPILTDDFNPLPALQAPMAAAYRELMLARFGPRLLAR